MAESKNLDHADEVRSFDKGKIELVSVNGQTVGRATFDPGWRWSECVKPIVGGDSCQVEHFGYVVSGRMALQFDDGRTVEIGPGDLAHAEPGHDAWIVGDQPCVVVDWQGFADYARR